MAQPQDLPTSPATAALGPTRESVLEKELAWEREKLDLLRAGWEREKELLLRPFNANASAEEGAVGIFWDFENCSPPLSTNPSALIKHLRTVFQPYGPIVFIRCYQDVASQPVFAANLRSGLEACGVEVRDCGRWGRKDVADHHIMADMLLFAIDRPAPATVVLISGDKDFSYLLSNLRNRKYNTILVENPVGAAEELKSAANKVFKWKDILRDAGGNKIPLTAVPGPDANTPRRPRANSDPESMHGGSPATKALITKSEFYANSPAPAHKTPSKSYGFSTPNKSSSSSAAIKPRAFFKPLIEVLEARPSHPVPLRSFISPLVTQHTADAFSMVGVKTWKDYVETAAASGVVNIGSGEKLGMEWISLNLPKATPSVILNNRTPARSNPIDSPSAPFAALRADSPLASSATNGTPRKHLLTSLFSSSPILKKDLPTHPVFLPLITVLSSLPSSPPPLRYVVSALLSAKHPDLTQQYGFKNIAAKACELGLIDLGGGVHVDDGSKAEWISLKDAFRLDDTVLASSADRGVKDPIPAYNPHTATLFAPLVALLNSLLTPSDPSKIPAASRGRLASQLKEAGSGDAFELVAVTGSRAYFELARRMGVVRVGSGKEPGTEWVALRKEYRALKKEGGAAAAASTPVRSATPEVPDPIVSAPATPQVGAGGSGGAEDPLSSLFSRSMNLGRQVSPLPSRLRKEVPVAEAEEEEGDDADEEDEEEEEEEEKKEEEEKVKVKSEPKETFIFGAAPGGAGEEVKVKQEEED